MILPVSWQMGWDFCLASSILRSMILRADSAMVPFFSFLREVRMAFWTSAGISAEVRRMISMREFWSAVIKSSQTVGLEQRGVNGLTCIPATEPAMLMDRNGWGA